MISTNGLVINQHFCCGNLIEANLFFNSNHCKKEATLLTCCQKKEAAKNLATCGLNKTKKCCSEKTVFVQVDNEYQPQTVDFSDLMINFIAIIPTELFNYKLQIPTFQSIFKNYKPPLPIEKDIAVLFQVFRC